MSGRRPIVLAAGGTGGHVFPAQALAAELAARGHRLAVVTDRRGAGYGSAFSGLDLHTVRSASPAGGLIAKSRAAIEIGAGWMAARALFRRLQPAAVVGFGGYPSFPAMLAATRAKCPTVLHEQNAVLGRVNRLLAAKVSAIALSFPCTAGLNARDQGKAVVTGNPVREAFAALREVPYSKPDTGPLRLLITGGSQGARIMSDVVPGALAGLPEGLRGRLRISQQCRAEDIERVGKVYAEAGITADLSTFIDNLPALLASAHLAITRGGASTVSELALAGRPAVIVPFSLATDDHQTANAKSLVAVGGAWMVPEAKFTATVCRQTLQALFEDPLTLQEMADSVRKVGRARAAADLADAVERLAPANGDDIPTDADARRAAA